MSTTPGLALRFVVMKGEAIIFGKSRNYGFPIHLETVEASGLKCSSGVRLPEFLSQLCYLLPV